MVVVEEDSLEEEHREEVEDLNVEEGEDLNVEEEMVAEVAEDLEVVLDVKEIGAALTNHATMTTLPGGLAATDVRQRNLAVWMTVVTHLADVEEEVVVVASKAATDRL